jgi:hypothetical protein
LGKIMVEAMSNTDAVADLHGCFGSLPDILLPILMPALPPEAEVGNLADRD